MNILTKLGLTRTTTFMLLILLLLLQLLNNKNIYATAAAAPTAYALADIDGETDDTIPGNSAASSSTSNDDIYESTLLQQALDTEEYRNSIESETLNEQTEPNLHMRSSSSSGTSGENSAEIYAAAGAAEEQNNSNSQKNRTRTGKQEKIITNDDESHEYIATATIPTTTATATQKMPILYFMQQSTTLQPEFIAGKSMNNEDATNDYEEPQQQSHSDKHLHEHQLLPEPLPQTTSKNKKYDEDDNDDDNDNDRFDDIGWNIMSKNSMENVLQQPQQPQAHIQTPDSIQIQNKTKTSDTDSEEYYTEESRELKPDLESTERRNGVNAMVTDILIPIEATTTEQQTTTTTTTTPITAATAEATAPTATTPIATTRKQSKKIHPPMHKPELLPEQLRNYIKDVYIRMPLAVIVDPSAASLDKTKILYHEALHDKNINIKIVLVTLNDSGVPSAFNFNNTQEFLAGLNSTRQHEGGNPFIGVLTAAELVPYDSAVFISTAAISPHTELVQDAAITLLKKRIRLFLLWYGEHSSSENETEEIVGGILGEVAIRSGGEIIHIVGSKHSQEIDGGTLTLIADAYRGAQELDVPVDTTMSSLHLKIDAPMRRATLITQNGEINLKKLVKFKPIGTHIEENNEYTLDAYIPLNKLHKSTTFTLKLTPELELLDRDYNVFLRAERKADLFLGDVIKRFETYFLGSLRQYKATPLRLQDARTAVKFPNDENNDNEDENNFKPMQNRPKSEVETFSDTEVHGINGIIGNKEHNQTVFAATAIGVVNEQRAASNYNLLQRCGTKIEMNPQSQLRVAPGTTGQLLFDVTNMRGDAVFHNIQVTDERRFLVRLAPQSVQLAPYQTATVAVTVLVPASTAQGTIDRITFTTHGRETASLPLILKVVTSIEMEDTTPPTISWEFGNRCDYVAADAQNCAERFWTLDIVAQDWQSGIMRLQTTPADGLFYRNSYTVGSTEPLKASYMATCCEPRVSLLSYDASGNQRTYNIDVRDIVLTEASIAAITLGAILLLLLIILIIVGIVWCCRRRKVSLELPTYRSHSSRSME